MPNFLIAGQFTLRQDPVMGNELVTKQYVDTRAAAAISATEVVGTGTFPPSMMPGLTTGDLILDAGTNVFRRKTYPGTQGTWTKLNVNTRGVVIGAGNLTSDDLVGLLPWSKFSQDRPTTFAGYGITDAFSTIDLQLTGPLSVTGTPSASTHLVNKAYVDAAAAGMGGGGGGVETGDFIRYPVEDTLSGYLRCNGAEVSQTTYADLYAVVGDRYAAHHETEGGFPWSNQYISNTLQPRLADLTGWGTEANTIPANLGALATIVTGNKAHVIGGFTGAGWNTNVYTATVNSDGTLSSWSTTVTSVPNRIYHSVVAARGFVFVVGGNNYILRSQIQSDGSLGEFTTLMMNSLPVSLDSPSVFVVKDKLYVVGGRKGSEPDTWKGIYVADIDADGWLSDWVQVGEIPFGRFNAKVAVVRDRIYLIGGEIFTTSIPISDVIYTTVNQDGTLNDWQTSGSLPDKRTAGMVYTTQNTVYYISGHNGAAYFTTVYAAPVEADGSLGTWTTLATSIPGYKLMAAAVATKNSLYLVGGNNGAVMLNTVYKATIAGGANDYSQYYTDPAGAASGPSGPTTGGGRPWEQQSGISTSGVSIPGGQSGFATWSAFPVSIYAASLIVTKDRAYTIGGYINDTPSAAIYSAAINVDGTIGSFTLQGGALPYATAKSQAVFTKNRVYVLGGISGNGIIGDVSTAVINSDGTLGAFTQAGSLFNPVADFSAAVIGSKLYTFGGYTTAATSAVYSYPIDADGVVDFNSPTVEASLAQPISGGSLIVLSDRIHIVGGVNDMMEVVSSTMNATIDANGVIGTWTLVPPDENSFVSTDVMNAGIIVLDDKAILIGGKNGLGEYESMMRTVEITSGNMLGTVTDEGYLEVELAYVMPFASNSEVFVVGGQDSTSYGVSSVYYGSLVGSTSDLSPYYASVSFGGSSGLSVFTLPDLTSMEVTGSYFYIKT